MQVEHVEWQNVSVRCPHHERGQDFLCFQSGFESLNDMLAFSEKAYGDRDFVVDAGRRMTFAQFFQASRKLAGSIAAVPGMRAGDRVGVCGKNSLEWILCYVAVVSCGLIAVPMNSWWTAKELQYAMQHAGLALLFADKERADRLGSVASIGNTRVVCMDAPGFAQEWMGKDRSEWVKFPYSRDDAAMIMYTSGTTSFPKGVVLTHRGIAHQLNVFNLSRKSAKSTLGEATLLPVPLFHATGLYSCLFNTLIFGRKLVLMGKWNVDHALELIEAERVTHLTAVPTMVLELMSQSRKTSRDISSLRQVGSGGSPPPAGVAQNIKRHFNGANPSQGYGLTEVNAVATTISSKDYLNRPTSCGKPVPGVQVEIWTEEEDNVQCAPGVVGRIVIRGANLMREYWNDLEATSKAITKDGFFKCGDLGYLDQDGFLYIAGRSQDLIIRGGENVSARTVEEAVYANLPDVQECAVFAVPHERLGEEVGLAVYMKPGCKAPNLAEVRLRCQQAIAGFMLPSALTVFPTELPKGATGKQVKRDIKDMLRNGKLAHWETLAKL